jgi:hypothetical protein
MPPTVSAIDGVTTYAVSISDALDQLAREAVKVRGQGM